MEDKLLEASGSSRSNVGVTIRWNDVKRVIMDQKNLLHYDDNFSPVVRFQSIRVLLAFALQNDLLLHQMNVVTAFLNGTLDLEEAIYMQQPDSYLQQGKEHLVCKLKKSLYGLKHLPQCWNKVLTCS